MSPLFNWHAALRDSLSLILHLPANHRICALTHKCLSEFTTDGRRIPCENTPGSTHEPLCHAQFVVRLRPDRLRNHPSLKPFPPPSVWTPPGLLGVHLPPRPLPLLPIGPGSEAVYPRWMKWRDGAWSLAFFWICSKGCNPLFSCHQRRKAQVPDRCQTPKHKPRSGVNRIIDWDLGESWYCYSHKITYRRRGLIVVYSGIRIGKASIAGIKPKPRQRSSQWNKLHRVKGRRLTHLYGDRDAVFSDSSLLTRDRKIRVNKSRQNRSLLTRNHPAICTHATQNWKSITSVCAWCRTNLCSFTRNMFNEPAKTTVPLYATWRWPLRYRV